MNGSFSLFMLISVGVISFGLGLLYKTALVKKQRKRVLNLEDEMLANHSRLLALEKKLSEAHGSPLPPAIERKIS